MRTKTLLCAAVLAAGVATSMAQSSNVYSLNVVGYYNITAPANKLIMIANQFVNNSNTVEGLFANLPNVPRLVQAFSGVGYTFNNYDTDLGWDDPSQTLGKGQGFFFKNAGSTNITLTFTGDVNQAGSTNNFTANALKLTALDTPQAGDLETDFGLPVTAAPGGGGTLQRWLVGSQSFTFDNYDTDLGWDAPPTVIVGEGFFMKFTGNKSWVRNFTVP